MTRRKGAALAVAAALLAVFAAAGIAHWSDSKAGNSGGDAASSEVSPALIQRGEYLAKLGDCAACHSIPGAPAFSGGLKMVLPIGSIYTTNITPDMSYGIGRYTFTDFDRALRWGVADGHTLYPAMPFPSYSIIKREDMQALYAYFKNGVTPAAVANKPSSIVFPLSLRFPLTYWRWAFAPTPKPFDPTPYADPVVAQGAYFVQGLGHCGECHTPRGLVMQVEAQNDRGGSRFLRGGPVESWYAPSLRNGGNDTLGAWNEEDIARFLTTGANRFGIAFGSMTDVIAHSSQYLSHDDAVGTARYLKSIQDRPTAAGQPYAYDDRTERALADGDAAARGALLYLDNCAACHRPDGKGYEGVFPSLAGNPVVETDSPMSLISIVLLGSKTPRTPATPARFAMPGFAWRLSDQEASDIVSFIRSSWGNAAPSVAPRRVAAIRASSGIAISPSQ